jgi:IMP dehydrogenase
VREALSYDDVLLVPKYSTIQSRADVNIGNRLDDEIYFDLPIIASPMDTVSEEGMAIALAHAGGMAIIHRYNTVAIQSAMVYSVFKELDYHATLGAAIGATGDYVERTRALIDSGATIICIDVAHGHHRLLEKAIKVLRDEHGNLIHLMAGNIATREGMEALADWGVDSVRVGIGGGSICSTRLQTGHGVPGLQSLLDCSNSDRDITIIADGGIKNSGDIVKALAAGADFVMVGSLLAGTSQAPGKIMSTSEGKFKVYRGMASREAQESWRGKSSTPEGVAGLVSYKGDARDILNDLKGGIASGFSYSGAHDINELWGKAEFIRQTYGGQRESATRVLELK